MQLIKSGKIVYVEDATRRARLDELAPADVEPLVLNIGPFGPAGEFFGYCCQTCVLRAVHPA